MNVGERERENGKVEKSRQRITTKGYKFRIYWICYSRLLHTSSLHCSNFLFLFSSSRLWLAVPTSLSFYSKTRDLSKRLFLYTMLDIFYATSISSEQLPWQQISAVCSQFLLHELTQGSCCRRRVPNKSQSEQRAAVSLINILLWFVRRHTPEHKLWKGQHKYFNWLNKHLMTVINGGFVRKLLISLFLLCSVHVFPPHFSLGFLISAAISSCFTAGLESSDDSTKPPSNTDRANTSTQTKSIIRYDS